MQKIFGLIRTLGWKHFLWKLWLLGKKKLGLEALLAVSVAYDSVQIAGLKIADFAEIGKAQGFLSENNRQQVQAKIAGLGLPVGDLQAKTSAILDFKIPYFSKDSIAFEKWDFNYNPVENIHLPKGRHSSRFFSFDPRFGDLKKAWEINRFQWTNILLTSYLLESNVERKKAIRDFVAEALKQWLAQCPHEYSVAWACSQEISIRCLNWIWSIWLLEIKDHAVLAPVYNAIYLSAAHVFRQIDFARAQRNNHAITESVFLIFFSKVFPQLPDAGKYREKGEDVLAECLEDQFFDDGGYIQNSHTYHRFALQSLCAVYPLVENAALRKLLLQKMRASFEFLSLHMASENGNFPNFGPNDGAMLFNFGGNDYRDLRPLLNSVAVILDGTIVYDDPAAMADAMILQLKNNESLFHKNVNNSERGNLLSIFARSGHVVIKNGQFKVFFRCADLTGRYPSSCDQLHVDLWCRGRNVLTDTGSWEYYHSRHPEHYHLMLSTRAHNTLLVDGKEQMEKGPRFAFLTKANGKITGSDPGQLSVAGEHDGFQHRVRGNTTHRRELHWQEQSFVIEDTVTDAAGAVALFWHFGADEVVEKYDDYLILKTSGLKMTFRCGQPLNIVLDEFPVSLYYGSAVQSPMIKITVENTKDTVQIETYIKML